MVTKKVTKLWKGEYLSVRDYEVQPAIKAGGLRLIYQGEEMILHTEDLQQLKPTSKLFKSKTGGKDYRLIDIKWNPRFIDTSQLQLF